MLLMKGSWSRLRSILIDYIVFHYSLSYFITFLVVSFICAFLSLYLTYSSFSFVSLPFFPIFAYHPHFIFSKFCLKFFLTYFFLPPFFSTFSSHFLRFLFLFPIYYDSLKNYSLVLFSLFYYL